MPFCSSQSSEFEQDARCAARSITQNLSNTSSISIILMVVGSLEHFMCCRGGVCVCVCVCEGLDEFLKLPNRLRLSRPIF